jgi:intein/homing endonuclease
MLSNAAIEYFIDKKGRECALFNGIVYLKEPNGYYKQKNNWYQKRNSVRLHRAVYEYYNGEIPKSCNIHHIDENKEHNDVALGYSILDITSIERIGKHDVYNMEVERYHNFAVNGGIIVHNCDVIRYYVNTVIKRRIMGR